MRLFFLASLSFLLFACQTKQDQSSADQEASTDEAPSHHMDFLTQVFEAHGGYERWSQMKSLSYRKGEEVTVTNLENRKIRVEDGERVIGFDGSTVWVSPDSADASRARFYHNLYFYFYAMPFVVGDPGAYYEELPTRKIKEKTYKGIKVSYEEGVGDASDDNYVLWVDPESNRMEWLMYTVTYRSGEPNDNYRLIHYKEWGSFNELRLPTQIQWYHFDGDSIGSERGDPVMFTEIVIGDSYPADSLFSMPEGAIVAPR